MVNQFFQTINRLSILSQVNTLFNKGFLPKHIGNRDVIMRWTTYMKYIFSIIKKHFLDYFYLTRKVKCIWVEPYSKIERVRKQNQIFKHIPGLKS